MKRQSPTPKKIRFLKKSSERIYYTTYYTIFTPICEMVMKKYGDLKERVWSLQPSVHL